MKISYEQAKKDYLYLENLHPGGDMVEITADVFSLMANPSKTLAKKLYLSAIEQWFKAIDGQHAPVPRSVWRDPEVLRIADRYQLE